MNERDPKKLLRRDWPSVMAAARELFPARNRFGVFAFGIGPRVSEGRARSDFALNVFVTYKHPRPKHVVPSLTVRSAGRRLVVTPNVIATGRSPRAHAGPAPFNGLYAGSPIRTGSEYGGVACFLGADSTATHLLTAGHLFSPSAAGATVYAARNATSSPIVIGRLVLNLLDSPGIDAAVVELTDAGKALLAQSQDGPSLQDVVGEDVVWNRPVCAFRSATHDFSNEAQTAPAATDAYLSATPRGSYWVRGVVATQGSIIEPGDSGSILCSGASNEFALGICLGDYQAQSVFEPISRALNALPAPLSNLSLIPN
jgi:hypothetical protein